MSVNHEEIAMMRDRAKAFGPSVRQRKVNPEITIGRAGTVPDYLFQKEMPVSGNIRLLQRQSQSQPLSQTLTRENSSTPDLDSIESDERSEYESRSEEETPEANLPAD